MTYCDEATTHYTGDFPFILRSTPTAVSSDLPVSRPAVGDPDSRAPRGVCAAPSSARAWGSARAD